MKAITIWQPYAVAIKLGLKHYETRTWSTNYRGPIVIHAAQKKLHNLELNLMNKYAISQDEVSFGNPILICEIEDCIKMTKDFINAQPQSEIDFGNWQEGCFSWKLKIKQFLTDTKRVRGQQGLWNINLDA